MTRVKICCISSKEEALMAVDFGADAIGLVGKMPSGPGPIEDSLIREIAKTVPPPVATFLLTSEITADGIIAHHQRTFTSTIQIVDHLPEQNYGMIRAAFPSIKLVQVIHVMNEQAIETANKAAAYADAILLDSGNPNLAIKELGGTGRIHSWELSRRIVESIPIPVFLAGGLNPSNVRQAIDQVNPYGVDVCSGLRSAGLLDPKKLEAFFKAIT